MTSKENNASSFSLFSSYDDTKSSSSSTLFTAEQDFHFLNRSCSDSNSDGRQSSSSSSPRKLEIEFISSSSSSEELSQTFVCDDTVDETITSSHWSQESIADRASRDSWIGRYNPINELCFFNPLRLLQICSFCFQPPVHEVGQGKHKDCFVAVDRSSSVPDEGSDCSRCCQYTPALDIPKKHETTLCRVQFDQRTKKSSIFTPLDKNILSCKRFVFQSHWYSGQNLAESNPQYFFTRQDSATPSRQTPITVDSKTLGSTKNGGISSNTLHRRAYISAGFFTIATLEAINSFDQDGSQRETTTQRSPTNEPDINRASDVNRSALKTPASRPRLDSELFRNTIGEVTCEKRANSEDDVSPIESEEEFSLIINSEVSIQSKSPSRKNVRKRLNYGAGKYANEELLALNNVDSCDEVNLSDDVSTKTEVKKTQYFPEFKAKIIETIHALVPNKKNDVHQNADVSELKEFCPQPIIKAVYSRQHLYMRKSISFIKALRKSGRTGKCLIQGWIAFRQSLSWREISECARRCDFRYIVLLDDMPLLHIFGSKSKQRKGEPKPNLLASCVTFDLTKEVAAGVKSASKELGHEVYLVESESNKRLCSMLPVGMKNHIFLDKHKSRLAKGDVLGDVFRKTRSSAEATCQGIGDQPRQKVSINTNASNEQNDASRHLLFVLSAAIEFPPPRAEKTIGK